MAAGMIDLESFPNELLLAIFCWIKAYHDLGGDDYEGPPHCAYLSQVSRRWRRVAHACSELWANWPRYRAALSWTEICYGRTTKAPLVLCLLVGSRDLQITEPTAAAVHLATQNISRAKSIIFRQRHRTFRDYYYFTSFMENDAPDPDPAMQVLSALSHRNVPILKCLSLDNHRGMIPLLWMDNDVLLLTSEELPHLQKLSLHGYLVSVSPTMHLASLRVLDIRLASAWRKVDDMIQFLRGIPNLEELTYLYDDEEEDHDYPPVAVNKSQSTTYPIRCVAMPQLKRLILPATGGFKSGAILFSYCSVAAQTALCLEADEIYFDWHSHFDLCAQALRGHFAEAIAAGHVYDVVTVNNRIISPDISRQTSPSHTLPTELSFSIVHSPHKNGQPDTVMKTSCELYLSLPIFANTSELRLDRDHHRCFFRINLFPTFPVLRTLILGRDALTELTCGSLWDCGRQFPGLEVLRLADYDRYDAAEYTLSEYRDNLAYHVVEGLCSCFSEGGTSTWRMVEFENFRYGELIAERIRGHPELRAFNEKVEICCIDCGE